ncbi:MAG: hypothetical protein ACOYB8_08755 [Eubacteriaceae bacterium]|jgi:hypothetical protein
MAAQIINNAVLLQNKDTEIAVGTYDNELILVFKSMESVLTETFHIAQEGKPEDYKISTISANYNRAELSMNDVWVDKAAFSDAIRQRAEDYVGGFDNNEQALDLMRQYLKKFM